MSYVYATLIVIGLFVYVCLSFAGAVWALENDSKMWKLIVGFIPFALLIITCLVSAVIMVAQSLQVVSA